ncbi:MAG: Hint domain-containing protein [Paracoccaceae bacterium]|nr:MAG: Hint domain-containing protein [Paracoccaceae bacterium]
MVGDEIGTYTGVSSHGNGSKMTVTLTGVQPLGTSQDVFRIVVTQVNNGVDFFHNGQWVSIYTYSPDNPQGTLVYSWLNPQDDMFQGKASGSTYQIFSSSSRLLFDVNGITPGTRVYGPDINEPLGARLRFSAYATSPDQIVICFAAGTRILTAQGPRRIETLRRGDRVWTRDHGMQPLRWIGRRQVCGTGDLAPVCIDTGAFGNTRPVTVSPQHRILVSGWRAELHFGEPEVLVAALHLVDGARVRVTPRSRVDYVHIAFDRHEIISAEGMLTESLYPGPMALAALPEAARRELAAIFPELVTGQSVRPASRMLTGREAGLIREPA